MIGCGVRRGCSPAAPDQAARGGCNMASNDSILTADQLRAALHYDPETGVFTWRERSDRNAQWNSAHAGRRAGYRWKRPDRDMSYLRIRLSGFIYRAHRLAWLYMKGGWPPTGFDVDHEDGDGLNNRWTNLRLATGTQNNANSRRRTDNTSGFKGVRYHAKSGRYQARITRNGRQRSLGLYPTPEEAHSAYTAAASELFGDFARGK